MVDDLTIKCKYFREGCEQMLKVGELKNHQQQCLFYPVCCPNQGCDFIATRRLIKDHIVNCEYKTEICQKGC